jgi:hypothetical protein
MINSEQDTNRPEQSHDEAVDAIVRNGAAGAVVLAGLSSAIVTGLWLAFYFLVFIPRGAVP